MKKIFVLMLLLGSICINLYAQNVGIGTNTPAFKLDVLGRMRVKTGTLGNVNTSSGIWFEDYRDATNRFFVGMKDSIRSGFYGSGPGGVGWNMIWNTKDGTMGLGILDPKSKLSINGSIALYSGTDPDTLAGRIFPEVNDLHIKAVAAGNADEPKGNILLQVRNPRLMETTGNVGIAVDTPTARLHISGDQKLSGKLFLQNGTTVNKWSFDAASHDLLIKNETSAAGSLRLQSLNPQIYFNNSGTDMGHLFSVGNDFFIGTTPGNSAGSFILRSGSGNRFWITPGGQISMGNNFKVTPGYWVNVTGNIICEEVKIQLQGNWPDYVFDKKYKLRSFSDLRTYINTYQHLPDIPSAAEIEQNGLVVGDIQKRMMEKIEELTLYILQLEEKSSRLEKELNKLKTQTLR